MAMFGGAQVPDVSADLSGRTVVTTGSAGARSTSRAARSPATAPLVLFQLNIANTWYPRLQQRRRDGHTGAAAGLDQDRAAAVAHQAQGFGAGRAGAPAVSADRRSAPGPVDRRGRGPGGLPLHGRVRL